MEKQSWTHWIPRFIPDIQPPRPSMPEVKVVISPERWAEYVELYEGQRQEITRLKSIIAKIKKQVEGEEDENRKDE